LTLAAPGLRRLDAATAGVELWLVDVDAQPERGDDGLSADECERAARFVFERDRRRYRAAHRVLRVLLAERIGPAAREPFQLGPHGRPSLRCHRGIDFNLSHSDRWALVGLCDTAAIGVDIEVVRAIDGLDALTAQNFTAAEQSELMAIPQVQRLGTFLGGWTRKEACLKAVGSGLSIAPETIDVGMSSRDRSTSIAVGSTRWEITVQSLIIDASVRAAVAFATRPTPLDLESR
jgi:4'-phosphopantetheinyl transferase